MSHHVVDPQADLRRLKRAGLAALGFVGLLWLVAVVGDSGALDLYRLGVYPRHWAGLVGVLSAPLVHGSYGHLFANTLPLFVLGTATLYGYPRAGPRAIGSIYAGSGLGVWLFGRVSFHIGASGLAHGLMFFVFVIGILRRDALSIALSLIVFFLYGSMVWGVFPTSPGVSFEYHFFGALCGTLAAILLRNRDPARPRRRYEWEDETEPDEPRRTGQGERKTPPDRPPW